MPFEKTDNPGSSTQPATRQPQRNQPGQKPRDNMQDDDMTIENELQREQGANTRPENAGGQQRNQPGRTQGQEGTQRPQDIEEGD